MLSIALLAILASLASAAAQSGPHSCPPPSTTTATTTTITVTTIETPDCANTSCPGTYLDPTLQNATCSPIDSPVPIYPHTLSQSYSAHGTLKHATGVGHISRTPTSGDDVSTIATFSIPDKYAGNMCSAHVTITGADRRIAGSQTFDAFTAFHGVAGSLPEWGPNNGVDEYVGRMKIDGVTGEGSWVGGEFQASLKFPCLVGEVSGVMMPVGDEVDIFWTGAHNGVYITVHPCE